MKVLLLGSGGRESALASALARSAQVDELVASPGNPGIARLGKLEDADIVAPPAVVDLARRIRPDLVVVGPEAPLVAGVGDALRSEGFAVFGPGAAAARIEGSKAYAKELMDEAGVATARWQRFEEPASAIAFLDELGPPYVVKADGLAAGKGVAVTTRRDHAVSAVEDALVARRFGAAGDCVVIEEFLEGPEVSLIAFSDGTNLLACDPAQDYKRAFDDDEGPNTGGMGSYSPVPACPPETARQVVEEVLRPVVRASAARGAPFVGALYAGLVLTAEGPKVLEFNARFGDPETQALLPRLESDFAEVAAATASGDLAGMDLTWSRRVAVAVVLAMAGYPSAYQKDIPIHGLDEARAIEDVHVFHAGTRQHDGSVVTAGGRVLAVSALGDTFRQARATAYRAADLITFDSKHMRRDIALRAERAEGAASTGE